MLQRRDWRTRGRGAFLAVLLLTVPWTTPGSGGLASQALASGLLEVTFFYLPPTDIHPTYHTAIWLEDRKGTLVKTLYVSTELSATAFKLGEVCPDWTKQAHWERADASEIDAVTGPTPDVGSGRRVFDLAALGVPPGTYEFRFQVHILDDYNILYRGTVTVGGTSPDEPRLEVWYSPARRPGIPEFVRDVRVRYVPVRR
jgi:hypothetical protein